MERLSSLDATFLHAEYPQHRMHLLGICVLEGKPPTIGELRESVAARLSLVPRFRQRVAHVPLSLGRPVWIDDENFNLAYHVRATALPRPGGERELQSLCDRLFAEPLDMDRPLWELWLIDGLGRGRFALAAKTHHAMVDGVSTVDLSDKLFSRDPDGEPAPTLIEWRPQPAPSRLRLLVEGVTDTILNPLEALLAAAGGADPVRATDEVAAAARGVRSFLPNSAPWTPLNEGRGGRDRRTSWLRVPLADLRRVRGTFDTTINNVVLSAIADGLGQFFRGRGDEVDTVRAFVPVSVRLDEERGALGNKVSAVYPDLPVGEAPPEERLAAVSRAASNHLRSRHHVTAKAISELGNFAPPTILAQAARLHWRSRLFNVWITNVPGPREPLYLLGRKIVETLPTVPVTPYHAASFAVVSYVDTMFFGITTDPARVPDGEDLAASVSAGIAALVAAADGRT